MEYNYVEEYGDVVEFFARDADEALVQALLEGEEEEKEVTAAVMAMILFDNPSKPLYKHERIVWQHHMMQLSEREPGTFHRLYRMPVRSFDRLCTIIAPHLNTYQDVAYGNTMTLTPEIVAHCMLRWLAGAAYADVVEMVGICTASFYNAVWAGMRAVCNAPEFTIRLPTTAEDLKYVADGFRHRAYADVIKFCVGAVDGWLVAIDQPSVTQVDNVRSFFSGHYKTFGVTVLAVVDHRGRFTYVDVAGPGSMNDVIAYRKSALARWVDRLPPSYYLVGDCAFPLTDKLLTPFSGGQRGEWAKSTFNYCLSQSRTKVEQTFGRTVTKFRLFRRPLAVAPKRWRKVIMTGARLHNYVIDERAEDRTVPIDPYVFQDNDRVLGFMPSGTVVCHEGSSALREVLVDHIKDRGLRRPDNRQRPAPNGGSDDDTDLVGVDEDHLAEQQHLEVMRRQAAQQQT
eukprot:GHVU01123824.1.p1 GENE.GHVU01123824.1~~GHVU01123824.1.p1  ORF type:complete len:456 (+),score=58.29 GHVU01123824.1:159-1526(+)